MKTVVSVVLGCLLFGTAFGYFCGWSDAREGRMAVLKSNIEVRNQLDHIFLVYSCKGKEIARFDVNQDALDTSSAGEENQILPANQSFFQKTATYAATFVAGGGAFRLAKYFKPALKYVNLSQAEKWKYFVVGIVSAGSGVYLGYSMGVRSLPGCDDSLITGLAKSPGFWKPMKDIIAKDEWNFAVMQFAAEGEPQDKGQILTDTLTKIEKRQVDASVFLTLLNLFPNNPPKPDTAPSQTSMWLSWDLVMTVYIPVILLIVVVAVSAERLFRGRAAKRRSRRKAS